MTDQPQGTRRPRLLWKRVGTHRKWRAQAGALSMEVRGCPRGCIWTHEFQARGIGQRTSYHDSLEDAQAAAELFFIEELRQAVAIVETQTGGRRLARSA